MGLGTWSTRGAGGVPIVAASSKNGEGKHRGQCKGEDFLWGFHQYQPSILQNYPVPKVGMEQVKYTAKVYYLSTKGAGKPEIKGGSCWDGIKGGQYHPHVSSRPPPSGGDSGRGERSRLFFAGKHSIIGIGSAPAEPVVFNGGDAVPIQ